MVYFGSLEPKPKRNRSCFVYGCFSTAANKPHLGFHKLPARGNRNIVVNKKNGDTCIYDRRQLWIEALNIGRGAALALDQVNVYVCSLHFARDDFYYNQDITGRRYLKESAIPRRNLPVRNSSPLTTKFNVRCLNRLKYRGYFNLHNPDGRKLVAPRTSLGANRHKETSTNASYKKTVWVVRKPPVNKEQTNEDSFVEDGSIEITDARTISFENNAQMEDAREEADENEQCTNLKSNTTSQPNNRWFTSELIIKEEPISDSEQEPPDEEMQEEITDASGQASMETNTEDDGIDLGYEPDDLAIQTEDGEGAVSSSPKAEHLTSTELNQLNGTEVFDQADESEIMSNEEEFEQQSFSEPEVTILEGFSQAGENDDQDYGNSYESDGVYDAENNLGQDYEVAEAHMNNYSEDDYLQEEFPASEPCETCGAENCEESHFPSFKDDYFVCLICSEIFPSQSQLAIHSKSHEEMSEEDIFLHEERTRNLTCEFCGRVLSTKSTLREHIMIHTGEKPHQCLLCGKSFRHKANLVVHVNGHAVVSTYKCKKCNKAFTKKMDFEKHLQFHVDASGNPLVCKICNAVFKSQRTLYNHSQLHSKKGQVRAKKRNGADKGEDFVCKICGRALSTKATLKEHMMIHSGEKPHVCNICGRTIRHKANFIVHVQTHGQGKSYECDMCDEAFMRKADLTQHKQLQHSKSKLLRCPICSEVFKSPQKFNRHMEIHESVVYMNETEELSGFEPHILDSFI